MKRAMWMLSVASVLLCGGVLAAAEEEAIEPKDKIALFDGKSFDGWVRYLRGGKGDPDKTWAIKEGGAIACTGRPAGYIRTEKAYKNYHLRLEYRWPGRTGNNGVLAHMVGKDNVWPKSLECQGQFHAQGDF